MYGMATGYGWTSTPQGVPCASLHAVDTICIAEQTLCNLPSALASSTPRGVLYLPKRDHLHGFRTPPRAAQT